MPNRSWLLFIVLLTGSLVAAPAHAQTGRVEGRVVEAGTDAPLEGVNVGLEGTSIGAATTADGTFVLDDVPAGTYTLEASFVGYSTAERSVRVQAGETARLRIRLSQETAQLSEITVLSERSYTRDETVTATRTATPVLETTRSVSTVTKELIEEQGAQTKKDLYRNVAGLNEFAFNSDVTLRGFRVSSPVLYNGLRGNPYGNFHLDPKLTNISRVDVLKGPSGVMYGSLPPGGLINMVTERPSPASDRSIRVRVGSFEERGLEAHLTGPLTDDETLLYRIDAEFEDSESFRDNQQSDFINVTGAFTWRPNDRANLTVEGGVFDETLEGQRERGIPFVDGDVFAVPTSFTTHEATDFFKNQVYYGEAHFDYQLTDALTVDASTRYFQNDAQEEYHEPRGVVPDETDIDGDGNTDELLMKRNFRSADREREGFSFNTNAIWDVTTGPLQHKILVGGDVFIEETKAPRFQRAISELDGGDVPAIELFSPDYNPGLSDTYQLGAFIGGFGLEDFEFGEARQFGSEDTRIGGYVQDQVALGDLRLSASLRFDSFDDEDLFGGEDFSDETVTVRGGALYKLLDNWSIYGSYSEGYEPQSPASQNTTQGGPFDPEESWQLEGGTKAQLFEGRLLTTITGYFIQKENVLVTDPENQDLLTALGEVESKGVEIEAVGNITNRFRISGNYAFNDIETTEDSNPDLIGQTPPNAPAHQASLWGSYAFLNGDVTVAAGPTYVSDRETFFRGNEIPEYVRIDAAASYKIESFTVRLNVDNVTDSTYLTGGFGGRLGGMPGAPRNVTLSGTYNF